jgi:ElaB/YqjD/DUF883 family membrane-anchored ribosome-binding protein
MSQTVAERTAEQIAESARQASRAAGAITDAIDDGVEAVRRTVKQGGSAADEILHDTTRRFRRQPVLTVATTFVIGVTIGTLLGWRLSRR